MELHALHDAVLGSLYHLQTATLQDVVEVHGGRPAADEGHGLGLLRLVSVNGLLGDGVGGGEQALHGEVSICVRLYGLVEAVTLDVERDARNNAVLGSLFEGNRAGGGLDVEIRPHAAHVLHARHHVLQVRVAVGNHLRPAVYRGYAVLGGGDAYRAADGSGGADGQRVPRPCDAHVGIGA